MMFFNIVPLIMEFTRNAHCTVFQCLYDCTVIQIVSRTELNLDRVSEALQSRSTLRPAGGHPWIGLIAGPEMAACRLSLFLMKLL
jgi:hypothetical protein